MGSKAFVRPEKIKTHPKKMRKTMRMIGSLLEFMGNDFYSFDSAPSCNLMRANMA